MTRRHKKQLRAKRSHERLIRYRMRELEIRANSIAIDYGVGGLGVNGIGDIVPFVIHVVDEMGCRIVIRANPTTGTVFPMTRIRGD